MKRLVLILALLCPSVSWAAIAGSNLTSGENTADQTSYTTASISPGANRLVILAVRATANGSGDDDTPIASGNGITWVQVDTRPYNSEASSFSRLTVFRGLVASPSSGAVTIDFEGVTMGAVRWTVDEFTGIDTSGSNGSGALGTPCKSSNDNQTSMTCTLGAFASGSGAFAAISAVGGITITPEAGWTQLAHPNSILSMWRATSDTSPSGTFSTADAAIVAFEIKIPSATRPVFAILEDDQ